MFEKRECTAYEGQSRPSPTLQQDRKRPNTRQTEPIASTSFVNEPAVGSTSSKSISSEKAQSAPLSFGNVVEDLDAVMVSRAAVEVLLLVLPQNAAVPALAVFQCYVNAGENA